MNIAEEKHQRIKENGTPIKNQHLYIQEGRFYDTLNHFQKGFDQYIALEYMGAAEYEDGALSSSLKRIRGTLKKHSFFKVPDIIGHLDVEEFMIPTPRHKTKKRVHTHRDIELIVFCKKEVSEEIIDVCKIIAKNQKNCPEFKRGISLRNIARIPADYPPIKNKRSDVYNWPQFRQNNLWWDIYNDWFVIESGKEDLLLSALKSKE